MAVRPLAPLTPKLWKSGTTLYPLGAHFVRNARIFSAE
jgi:hypothetical protein